MEKAFEIQKACRDNVKDLQTYLTDLTNWEVEMKRKEAALNGEFEQDLPPVRSKVRKEKPIVQTKKTAGKRIASSDYKAWENFDVDKACEQVDMEDVGPTSLDGKKSQQAKMEKLREEAHHEKERGNSFVKQEKWDEAIACYNRAIELVQDDPIYYANRGLCYLKKDSLHQASQDCSAALRLDPTYVKALQRRAAAGARLGSLRAASADLAAVLRLEPHNAQARRQLDELRDRMGTKGVSCGCHSCPRPSALGSLRAASADLAAVLRLEPHNAQARRQLDELRDRMGTKGVSCGCHSCPRPSALGSLRAASADLAAVLRLEPHNAQARRQLDELRDRMGTKGVSCGCHSCPRPSALGSLRAASADLAAVLRLEPHNAQARRQLDELRDRMGTKGVSCGCHSCPRPSALGSLRAASADLAAVLRLEPHNAQARRQLDELRDRMGTKGVSCGCHSCPRPSALGSLRAASADLAAVLRLEPHNAQARRQLDELRDRMGTKGVSCGCHSCPRPSALGSLRAASADLAAVLRLEPHNAQARRQLDELRDRMGTKGVSCGCHSCPRPSALGSLRAASADLAAVLRLEPHNAQARRQLDELRDRMGTKGVSCGCHSCPRPSALGSLRAASADLAAVLRLEPHNAQARRQLDELRDRMGTKGVSCGCHSCPRPSALGSLRAASADLAAVLRLEPHNAQARRQLDELRDRMGTKGVSCGCHSCPRPSALGSLRAASADLAAVLRLEPHNAQARRQLDELRDRMGTKGVSCGCHSCPRPSALGSLRAASADLAAVLRLEPHNAQARRQLDELRDRMGTKGVSCGCHSCPRPSALGSLRAASADLAAVLRLEPHNAQARRQLDELRDRMGTKGSKSKSSPLSTPTAENKPFPKTGQAKIIELQDNPKEVNEVKPPSELERWSDGVGEAITVIKPVKKPPHLRSKRALKSVPINEIPLGKTEPEKPATRLQIVETDSLARGDTNNNDNDKTLAEVIGSAGDVKSEGDDIIKIKGITSPESEKLITDVTHTEKVVSLENLVPPVNSVQFMQEWKCFKGNDRVKAHYLSIIDPSKIPSIFENALETRVLSEFLRLLRADVGQFRARTVTSYLAGLSRVKRFSALAMFLSADDKQTLTSLLQHCKTAENCSENDIADLKNKFEL